MSEGTKLDVWKLISDDIETLNDDTVKISALFETQYLVTMDIIGPEVELSNMSASDICALTWLLENEQDCIASLR